MDLHAWITERVDAVERAEPLHQPNCDSVPHVTSCCGADDCDCFDTFPCDCDLPAAVLRRCEADRRILARHRLDPASANSWLFATACEGCGYEGEMGDPVTENLNDCPELLDLGYAHGLTDEILAGLDRPQPPEPARPRTNAPPLLGSASQVWRDALLGSATPPITTSDVPEALRGPRWKP